MESMRSIAAVVVVYNTNCADSLTCRGLEKMADTGIVVLIYDNSTEDYGNAQYCRDRGWVYLGGTGNAGLSRAYNTCIDYLRNTSFAGMVCLFDDDTTVDSRYFEILQSAVTENCRIYVPLIHSAGRLISPCLLRKGYRIGFFPEDRAALEYAGEEISAINSCMALDLSLFDSYRYDEAIFLDGIDHNFLSDMKARGEGVCVIPYCCDHAFSGDEKPPKKAALVRFGIFAKDMRYILRNDRKTYLYFVGKRMLRLSLQYRTLDFLISMKNI